MKPDTSTPAYVDIRQLHVTFTGGKKPVQAVSGVDLLVLRGEVFALIGESGSGKSLTALALMQLLPTSNRSPPFQTVRLGVEIASVIS